MKKTIIGGFLSLIGSIWTLAILIAAGNNLVSSWTTPPGRLLSTVFSMGLTFWFVFAIALTVFGLGVLAVELFKKD